jgi:hypothetical protein
MKKGEKGISKEKICTQIARFLDLVEEFFSLFGRQRFGICASTDKPKLSAKQRRNRSQNQIIKSKPATFSAFRASFLLAGHQQTP